MNKAFVREDAGEEGENLPAGAPSLPAGSVNYMTPAGHRRLREEFEQLVKVERPALVQVVSWAAGNGDRSENGDYIYGKKRLREIDWRIRYLSKRLDSAVVVDPQEQENLEQVFFGATVTLIDLADAGMSETTYQIVGVDEADAGVGRISWIAPLARALMKAREGDVVSFQSPAGRRELEVVEIFYR
ncbi:Transcription elongation factor GreB [Sterolibacterium denitrificans]|uniref:Transcription elongation factor GreB n=2 Tax=Sterolibacterium denitrificans TaxID=157592 RepID=A0A7Z7MVV8_9PROT|nr:transcription elongation factor GreB [Sterolibacterium denitrificans]KYC29164.1 transcription elongation factor GreB [Sterolibacterium denitrificans]SMB29369.1 Transcription elongation factor GreB [Sterolibacterium denitrificans]